MALRGIGFAVDVYERASGAMTSQGACIVVQDDLKSLLRKHAPGKLPVTLCERRQFFLPDGKDGHSIPMRQEFSSWSAIHRTLLDSFPAERYHAGSALTGFEQRDRRIVADFAGHGQIDADLLICADGSRSASRRRLLPDIEQHYAGYIAWRGTIEEKDLPPSLTQIFDRSFTICEARSGGHILCYFIPGANAAIDPLHRRLNWVWYVDVPHGPDLERLLTDSDGELRQGSVPPGKVPREFAEELRETAARELHPRFAELVAATASPFIQMIVDVSVSRMAFGRACLVGDAAFVLRPHIAAATAKAAADAMSLSAALAAGSADPDAALRLWESRQLEHGKSLLERSAAVGKASVQWRHASASVKDLAARFAGLAHPRPHG
jgi:2-polyprenyl-6-methoxyphenol hydroxylase-like FAD-dependent oxidoreductase